MTKIKTKRERIKFASDNVAGAGPKGLAVRQLKWYVSWVQTVVRQVGPYLVWVLDD